MALTIFLYGWNDGDDIELNRRKREYLGLSDDEMDVLQSPLLSLVREIIGTELHNTIDIKLFKEYIYKKFSYIETGEYDADDSIREKLPTISSDRITSNPLFSERLMLMDKYIELKVYENTGITMFEYLALSDLDLSNLNKILTNLLEANQTTMDELMKEDKE